MIISCGNHSTTYCIQDSGFNYLPEASRSVVHGGEGGGHSHYHYLRHSNTSFTPKISKGKGKGEKGSVLYCTASKAGVGVWEKRERSGRGDWLP